MKYTLLGSGFSRNWGDWLAEEVFEYLLGCTELSEKTLRYLWETRNRGGFEEALSLLRADHSKGEDDGDLITMQNAIIQMFKDMNTAFASPDLFHNSNGKVSKFLARFDAIFTLNQDFFEVF